ncbi:MAG: manganese efflux pump MntP family protein [Mogibacterium sp.]|nr:manganese efflux pump MntP family protein [Mogibacterium sp.]
MIGISMTLVFNSILLGVGLAMDAFSVSLANGLNEPEMKGGRMLLVAGTFGAFQFAMPMIGWICVHAAVQKFQAFQKYIPWIALLLLLYIGGKTLLEGIRDAREKSEDKETEKKKVAFGELMVQGVATAIDALSVGFTIAEYNGSAAFCSSIIIGIVTLAICLAGLALGKKFGTRLAGKASILGGVILIGIGLEIWISGVFF